MSAEVPPDLREAIQKLEIQALDLLNQEKYEMAKRIYQLIYETLYERQTSENRRIHLGAPLHMIGLSLLLQRKIEDGFKHFLLAYIADTMNVRVGNENAADSAPACNALKTLFGVSDYILDRIKRIVKSKTNRTIPFDPAEFLNEFMRREGIHEKDLLKLSGRYPDGNQIEQIRNQLFQQFLITPEGKKLLDEVIGVFGSKVLLRAAQIAKKEGHPQRINEEDVKKALSELSPYKEGGK